ncbi:hypothetical protein [Pseudaminobacter soli (ex Zhang et al. 2022)]|uniref:hypothetical protein n=1 Tax=Pseudaminobacter soli (ex Zhang et al. 2022) TaxID=2831468 RepID=UPI001AEE8F47|nr:hypothetical protein [Pseudaminobacter soli]
MVFGSEGAWRISKLAGAVLVAVGLSACTSAQDVLEPSAIAPTSVADASDPSTASVDQSAATLSTAATSPAPAATATQSAALIGRARVYFAPLVGASVEAATSLSERLATRAKDRGIRITGSSDTTTTHLLKGYFTPLVEGRETTVIYVWDVYDPTGNRIHRISGQQKVTSAGGEGWAAVPDAAMQAIADSTVEQLTGWLAGGQG